jgi:hypothetical protein
MMPAPRVGGVGISPTGVKQYQGGITMRLGREQAAGYVEDTEADPLASAELAAGAPALAPLAPDPLAPDLSPQQPAVVAG